MMPQMVLDNLWPWVAQISILAFVGALLPAMLRIHHPRSQLIYCHSILVISLALPMIQPWRHPTIAAGPTIAAQAVPSSSVSMIVRIEGIVVMEGLINTEGRLENIRFFYPRRSMP